ASRSTAFPWCSSPPVRDGFASAGGVGRIVQGEALPRAGGAGGFGLAFGGPQRLAGGPPNPTGEPARPLLGGSPVLTPWIRLVCQIVDEMLTNSLPFCVTWHLPVYLKS